HEAVKTSVQATDFSGEAKKNPVNFITNQYGDHLITQPLKSLDSVLIPMVPIATANKSGFQSTAILPVPQVGQTWATHDVEAALNGDTITYKPDNGDLPSPIYAGAVVQNDQGARVVATGSLQSITNHM